MNRTLDLTKLISASSSKTFKINLKKEIETNTPANHQLGTYSQIALELYINEQFDLAIHSFELALACVEYCNNQEEIYELYKNYALALNAYGGDYVKAIEYLQKAHELLATLEIEGKEEEINLLLGLSRSHLSLSNTKQAKILAKEAVNIAKHLDDYERIKAYLNYADTLLESNNVIEAEEFYKKALTLAKDDKEIVLKGNVLMNLGTLYKTKLDYKGAINYYSQAKEIFEEIGFDYELAEVYINIGIVLAKLVRYDDAIRFLEAAKNYFLAIKHMPNVLKAYLNLGRVEQDRANYHVSIDHFDKALNIAQSQESFIADTALLLYLKGNSFYDLKQIDEAYSLYEDALTLANNINNTSLIATINNAIAAVWTYQKHFTKALKIYQENIAFFKKHGDIEELIATYTNLALLYDETGHFQEAYDTYQEALTLVKAYHLPYLEISILINQAELYQNFLEYDKALSQYNEILETLQSLDNDYYIAKVYHNMANIFEVTTRFEEAIEYANLSLTLKTSLGEKTFLPIYNTLARAYEGLGDAENAKQYYQKALNSEGTTYHKYGVLVNYALFLINQMQEYDSAINALYRAKNYFEHQEAIEPLIAVYDNLAKAYDLKNEPSKAIEYYKTSLELGKNILQRINAEKLHMQYRINFEYTYKNLIDLLLQTNNHKEALEFLEEFKSQTFRKMLSLKHFKAKHIPIVLLEKEQELTEVLLQTKFVENITTKETVYNALEKLYSEMEAYNKNYVALKRDAFLGCKNIKIFL